MKCFNHELIDLLICFMAFLLQIIVVLVLRQLAVNNITMDLSTLHRKLVYNIIYIYIYIENIVIITQRQYTSINFLDFLSFDQLSFFV